MISAVASAVALWAACGAHAVSGEKISSITAPWSQFGHDSQHSGRSAAVVPKGPLAPMWNISFTGAAYNPSSFVSPPTISASGLVYVGTLAGAIICLDSSTGAQNWGWVGGTAVQGAPALTPLGTVVFGCADGLIVCLDAVTGEAWWQTKVGAAVVGSASLGNGVVYLGSWDHKVYALNMSTGAIVWSVTTGNWVDGTPALSPDNSTVYVGSLDYKLYAINATSGKVLWTYDTGTFLDSSPAVDPSGTVFIGGGDGKTYAFSPQGVIVWTSPSAEYIWATPALTASGLVIVGAVDATVTAFDSSTGSIVWRFKAGSYVVSSAAIDDAGTVFVGSADGKLYALSSSSGAVLASVALGNFVNCQSVGPGGELIAGTYSTSGAQTYFRLA